MIDELADVIVSGEVGLAKPDPEIFRYALDRFGLEAGSTLMIDDTQENLDSAGRVGLGTILFTSADQLRADLVGRRAALSTRPRQAALGEPVRERKPGVRAQPDGGRPFRGGAPGRSRGCPASRTMPSISGQSAPTPRVNQVTRICAMAMPGLPR